MSYSNKLAIKQLPIQKIITIIHYKYLGYEIIKIKQPAILNTFNL